jgi:bacteriocin biosynthesis cyclodehydratase domain-containing protein
LQKPRIKRTIERIELPDGDVYLLWPSAGVDIRIEKPDHGEKLLLEAIDGEHAIEQLHDEHGRGAVDDTLSKLEELNVVEDAADDDRLAPGELERFDRQLRYFSDIGSELTPSECQERLRETKVAVLGVGGLGCWSALSLACTGVGEMRLIDSDVVEMSNLNRQIIYTEADLGQPKVECAAARLRAFNSKMRVTSDRRRLENQADIAEFIAGSDIVIDAADWPAHEIEHWCNAACFEAGIPYITMSHFPPIARVGPLYVPGETGCYACQEAEYRREYPLFDAVIEQRRAKPSPAATLGPVCGVIGGHVALDVLHLLTGLSKPSTHGVAHIYDLRTMEVERQPVVPEPGCPVCGDKEPQPRPEREEEEEESNAVGGKR